jgi:hypothetical protein
MNKDLKRFSAVKYGAVLATVLFATDTAAEPPPGPKLYGIYAVNGTVFCQPGSYAGAGGAYDVNVGTTATMPESSW